MMTKRISIILLAALVLTACGSSGKPKTFIDQPRPLQSEYIELADELLQNGAKKDGVPLAQRNFIEGCMSAGLSEDGDIIALANSCGCSYNELVKFVRGLTDSDIEAFEAFEAYDNELKEDDGFASLDNRVKDIFKSCQS